LRSSLDVAATQLRELKDRHASLQGVIRDALSQRSIDL
jgi:hypothetical protein